MRISEIAVHSWDIAVALDDSATLSPSAVELLVDSIGGIAGYSRKPGAQRFAVRIRTTSPARDLEVVVAETVSVGPASERAYDGEIELPTEAIVRLVYGRLDPAHSPSVK